MADDPEETVRRAARQAGIPLPEERVADLAQTLALVSGSAEALASLDLGEREPAFVLPPAKNIVGDG